MTTTHAHAGQSVPEQKAGEIHQQAHILENIAASLAEQLDNLRDDLDPVMSPAVPVAGLKGEAAGERAEESPLAEQLIRIGSKLRDLSVVMSDIKSRLQV
ncbi:hypothetical protein K32_48660 [Kaistia sp. 32K]|uniref:hypothetical protein n=1 Tax=Kaistia sp. 32K TaxID=2795690 RepID=UPI00191562E7|nr:hypothetical protein [Kaistia sp. 32K]BCP56249.1 hypothetical protein K32_48660 [Kaistia sp. 32K]